MEEADLPLIALSVLAFVLKLCGIAGIAPVYECVLFYGKKVHLLF
jgi:hypothetical protein